MKITLSLENILPSPDTQKTVELVGLFPTKSYLRAMARSFARERREDHGIQQTDYAVRVRCDDDDSLGGEYVFVVRTHTEVQYVVDP